MTRAGAAARFALSFLTVLPVPAGRVDREVAGLALALAPAVGALLGLFAGALGALAAALGAGPLLVAVLVVGALAGLTRALHLDGLADTADGLGSARPPAEALDVMRRSDIGPFGVVTLVLVLLTQVAALASLADSIRLVLGLAVAAATGRLAACLACRPGVPPARLDGLGALVAGAVPWPLQALASASVVLPVATLALVLGWLGLLAAVPAGLLAAYALQRRAVRRLGGTTGDVFGALIETATTAAFVVLALA